MGKALVQLAFEKHAVEYVIGACYTDNKASRRVMEKIGMTLSQSYWWVGWNRYSLHFLGRRSVCYQIQRDNWLKINAE